MQERLYRTQILLEPEQQRSLADIAQQQKRSISDLIRQIIRDWLDKRDQESMQANRLHAMDEIHQLRLIVMETHGIYQANFLEEARKEREEDFERILRGSE